MANEKRELIQWHIGFRGAVKTELEENQDILEYFDELAITKKELKIDLLVIKLKERQKIKNSIGHIFRGYNIFEYKGVSDYISLDDFYKVYAYACIFKSDTNKVNERKADTITLSFVSSHYPKRMISHLLDERGYKIKKYKNGIYHIIGDYFPIQIIINSQLDTAEHLWLKSLTSNVQVDILEKIILEYEQKKKDENREAVIDTVIKANYNSLNNIKEEDFMSKVLLEYMEPKIKAEAEKRAAILAETLAQQKAEVLAQQKAEVLAQQKAEVLAQQKAEVLTEKKLAENNKRIALSLKKTGMEISQIQDITNLTLEELKNLFSQS